MQLALSRSLCTECYVNYRFAFDWFAVGSVTSNAVRSLRGINQKPGISLLVTINPFGVGSRIIDGISACRPGRWFPGN